MNWNLIGHEWAVGLLQSHIAHGALRHAYLFTGPQGVGRRTLALRLAQAINCPEPLGTGLPCQTCRACQQIERMQFPDLSVIQPEAPGNVIKVDAIRDLQRTLALAPYQAKCRLALIQHFELAHPSAANALLKTLEEPAPQVILVLTAESAEALPATIVSRCEHLRLRPVPVEQLSQALSARQPIALNEAQMLAHISGGRPGYAIRLANDSEQLALRRRWLDEHARLMQADRVERFAYAEAISKDKDTLRSILPLWASLWRDVMVCACGASASPTNLDRNQEITALARRFGRSPARQMVTGIEHTLELLERNVNSRLAMEALLLDLPKE